MRNTITSFIAFAALLASTILAAEGPRILELEAKDTFTAIELDAGDTLRFTLRNGQERTLTLEQTDAQILLTNVPE